ncbi:hypothetical protein H4R22_002400 [Coemansia sp. RSA 1290]|nr:hypothetical protein H4R22_002400 [Coemansia sp. RSA 1290]
MCRKINHDSAILSALRLHREDFFCRICGFNALSELHLQLHIYTYHTDNNEDK